MEEKEKTKWHEIIQDILDGHLELMSGKKIERKQDREFRKYIQIDYFCEATESHQDDFPKEMVRPFDHLKKINVIEYKSIHEVLNERTFRNYVARALMLETSYGDENHQGKTTLTILTTRKPESLLGKYPVTRLSDWKYKVEVILDLEIYILVQKEMRGKREGDGLALLQVLEGERERQAECWKEILSQDLENVRILERIIENLNREVYMNFVKEIEKKQKREIAKKMLQEGISMEVILRITDLTPDEINQLQREVDKENEQWEE